MRSISVPPTIPSGFIAQLEQRNSALLAPEVARMLRLTPGTVYRLARQRAIPSFRVGGSLLFDPQRLAQWMRGTEAR
ncbi:MAG: helix-turn-helix domain-containing protein [Candidatus Sulfotelmatobacter sp.]